jgi:hypothetical protein
MDDMRWAKHEGGRGKPSVLWSFIGGGALAYQSLGLCKRESMSNPFIPLHLHCRHLVI